MRGISKRLITLAGILMLAACQDNSVGVVDAVSGNYSLSSVSGFTLPVKLDDSTAISGGSLTLNTNGTFAESLDFAVTPSGQTTPTTTTITCTGNVGQRGTNFDFSETVTSDRNCGGNYGGTWDGADTFSVTFNPSFVAVYNRTAVQP